jgi:hypothetical protein
VSAGAIETEAPDETESCWGHPQPVIDDPGTPEADRPAENPTEPDTDDSTDLGTDDSAEPAADTPAEPAAARHAEPEMQSATDPVTDAPTEPAATAPTDPAAEATAGAGAPDALTAQHRAVLALERSGWPSSGAKERAIRERLGLAPVRYYQVLNALLDDPRALAHDPVTVNRLRRVREARRAER